MHIHGGITRQRGHIAASAGWNFSVQTHSLTRTFTSDEQGQLSGVRLPAGLDEHDDLVVSVFGNVSTVDEHHQVSLQEFGLAPTRLQTQHSQT